MTECSDVELLLPAYLDGDVSDREREIVRLHLDGCEACRDLLARLRSLDARVASWPVVPEELRPRLVAIDQGVGRRLRRERSLWPVRQWLSPLPRAINSVAALLAICGIVGLYLSMGSDSLGTQTPTSAAPPTPAPLVTHTPFLDPATPSDPASPVLSIASPINQVRGDVQIAHPYGWLPIGRYVDLRPSISPDGHQLLFLPPAGDPKLQVTRLMARDLVTGVDRALAAPPGFLLSSARWSPDGRSIAFVQTPSDPSISAASELWIVDSDGGGAHLLYRGDSPRPSDARPQFEIVGWADGGQSIDVGQPKGEYHDPTADRRIRVNGSGVDPIGVSSTVAIGGSQVPFGSARASSSGDYALYTVKSVDLPPSLSIGSEAGIAVVRYDPVREDATVLDRFGAFDRVVTSISPDGTWVAILSTPTLGSTDPQTVVTIVRPDGAGLHLVKAGSFRLTQGGSLQWSSVGTAFLVGQPAASSASARAGLYEIDGATGQSQLRSTTNPFRDLLAVAPDGRHLVVDRASGVDEELDLLAVE